MAGLNPAMTTGLAGLVTSSTVIQVVLPKALISLVPPIVIGPVTVGTVLRRIGAVVGVTVTAVAKDQGVQVDGELAAAIGRGQQTDRGPERLWDWRRQGSLGRRLSQSPTA